MTNCRTEGGFKRHEIRGEGADEQEERGLEGSKALRRGGGRRRMGERTSGRGTVLDHSNLLKNPPSFFIHIGVFPAKKYREL